MTIHRSGRAFGCGLLAVLLTLAVRAHAVDGVIEINQARVDKGDISPGDTPGFPITISADTASSSPNSFRLTGPLFNSTAENAIVIISPHVTVDLNGFTVTCLNPPCAGFGILSDQANITVMNGTVRGFADGVNLSGSGAHVENVRALGNANAGVHLGSHCIAHNNIASGNGGEGIKVEMACTVSGNTANSNMTSGICSGQGSNVYGNTASGNKFFGLNLAPTVGYSQNVMFGNNNQNPPPTPNPQVFDGVSLGLNLCNGSITCP